MTDETVRVVVNFPKYMFEGFIKYWRELMSHEPTEEDYEYLVRMAIGDFVAQRRIRERYLLGKCEDEV